MCEYRRDHACTPQPSDKDDTASELSLEGFQVVRREFLSHSREPAITFNQCRVYVNAACLAVFPNTDQVQILVHQESRVLALRPCWKLARDAFTWRVLTGGRQRPRQVVCTLFFAKIASLMNWSADCRYRILGRLAQAGNDALLVFDLSAAEIYQNGCRASAKTRAAPVFPAEWRDQSGLPATEHAKAVEVPVLDGYTVYAMQDSPESSTHKEEKAAP